MSFKIDALARPECSMKLDPLTAFIFKLTLPAYFILAFVVWFWFNKFVRPRLTCWESHFVENHKVMMVAIRSDCLRASVQVLSFCYIYVVQKAASAGDCSFPDDSDVPVLDSNESITCSMDDELWVYMASIGFGVFLLYGVIAPWVLYRKLKQAHEMKGSKQKYNDPACHDSA